MKRNNILGSYDDKSGLHGEVIERTRYYDASKKVIMERIGYMDGCVDIHALRALPSEKRRFITKLMMANFEKLNEVEDWGTIPPAEARYYVNIISMLWNDYKELLKVSDFTMGVPNYYY